jgi:F-type H+-transporting ATPase subunit b
MITLNLMLPDMGLTVWMTLVFLLLLFILGKYAWKPIMKALKDREESISNSLELAKQTQEEMKQLQADNEALLKEARDQRDDILREAKKMKENIINEARTKAQNEADKITESARENILNEKQAAIVELKNQVADLSIEVAEKILGRELSDPKSQQKYLEEELKDINFN